jgi:hypothetical protein
MVFAGPLDGHLYRSLRVLAYVKLSSGRLKFWASREAAIFKPKK